MEDQTQEKDDGERSRIVGDTVAPHTRLGCK